MYHKSKSSTNAWSAACYESEESDSFSENESEDALFGLKRALCLEKSRKVSEGVFVEWNDVKQNNNGNVNNFSSRRSILGNESSSTNINPLKITFDQQLGRDPIGKKTVNEYRFIRTLGRGAYAKVKLAVHSINRKQYAIKILHRSLLLKSTRPVMNTLTGKQVLRSGIDSL